MSELQDPPSPEIVAHYNRRRAALKNFAVAQQVSREKLSAFSRSIKGRQNKSLEQRNIPVTLAPVSMERGL
jgi:hypothetical protein